MPEFSHYQARVKVRGTSSRRALAWVRAKNEDDAEDLLCHLYGPANVDTDSLADIKDLEPHKAEIFFPNDEPALTEIWAKNRSDARRSLRLMYGTGGFRLL